MAGREEALRGGALGLILGGREDSTKGVIPPLHTYEEGFDLRGVRTDEQIARGASSISSCDAWVL